MVKLLQIFRLGAMLGLAASPGLSATFYVATDGNDANSGTALFPWRTIQHAAGQAAPGDDVLVQSGTYDERVVTSRGGDNESARITFVAEGPVTLKGWKIQHPYITIDGFDITGWSSSDRNEAHVYVTNPGSYFHMLNCVMRDGIQAVRSDLLFHSGSNTLTSATGGFLSAGFAPGQTLLVGAASNGLSLANSGVFTIAAVTDTSITVTSALVDDGPLPIYLSSGYVFGLNLRSGTQQCVIRGNVFTNLGYDTWFIMGSGHLLENNRIEASSGWDAMHFGGTGHLFRGNTIRNSPLVVYQNSPDALENYTPIPYLDVTFSNNVIEGFAGVLASQKGTSANSTGLLLTHNVFVDVGRLNMRHPNTTIEQNTFLRVARNRNPVTSRASHPLFANVTGGASNIVIRNNVLVDCGEPTTGGVEEEVGWYEFNGPTDSIVAEGNFVAGGPPGYGAKSGWPEANPDLNGGDPEFVNPGNVLGADRLPFTPDDGLRLFASSKLVGAGAGGRTPGAYESPLFVPTLHISWLNAGEVRVSWPEAGDEWTLQSTHTSPDLWIDMGVLPLQEEGVNHAFFDATNAVERFRLRF